MSTRFSYGQKAADAIAQLNALDDEVKTGPSLFDFDAVASQTVFAVPVGWAVRAVYQAGTLKRLGTGTGKHYTVAGDGRTVTFNAAPGADVWISIMAVKA